MPKDNEKVLTISQQQVETWINDHEDQGEFLVQLGVITRADYDEGIAKDEQIRLAIEADPVLADRVVAGEVGLGEVIPE